MSWVSTGLAIVFLYAAPGFLAAALNFPYMETGRIIVEETIPIIQTSGVMGR
jgi:hypothetical protein